MRRREFLLTAGAAAVGSRSVVQTTRSAPVADSDTDNESIPNTRWTRTYSEIGDGLEIQLWQVLPGRGDGYLAIGQNGRRSDTGHHRWATLRKLDADGNQVWQTSFEHKLDKTKTEQSVPASSQVHTREDGVENKITDLVPAHDSGYVFCGYADWSQEISNPRHWLGKIDESGTLQWETEFRTGLWGDIFKSVTTAPNGGYVAVGERAKEDKTSRRGAVVKVDNNGTIQFVKEFENTSNEYDLYGEAFTDVVPAHDGGYVAASQRRTIKVTPEGSLAWDVTMPKRTAHAVRLPRGGYLVAGNDLNSDNQIRITKITTDGTPSVLV